MTETLFPLLPELAIIATLLPLAAMFVCRLFSKKSAAFRCQVWALTLLGLLIFPAASRFLPRIFPGKQAGPAANAVASAPSQISSQVTAQPLYQTAPFMENAVPEETAAAIPPVLQHHAESATPHHETVVIAQPIVKTEMTPKTGMTFDYKTPAVIAWLCGVLLGGWSLGMSVLAARKLIRFHTMPLNDPRWLQCCASTARMLRIRKTPRLLVCETIAVPMVAGIVRPVILIPNDTTLDPQSVLIHELSHIKRRDPLWLLVSRIVCVVYWFHPLAWFAAWKIRTERELACDDMVLESGKEAGFYATLLLELATKLPERNSYSGLTVSMARKHQIEERIDAILDTTKKRSPLGRRTAWGLLLLLLTVVCTAAIFSPFAPIRFGSRFVASVVHVQLVAGESQITGKSQENPANHAGESSPVPEKTVMIHGKVVDESDKPVVNARVKLFGERAENDLETITDGDGKFSLPKPEDWNFDSIYAVDADRKNFGRAYWFMNRKTNEIQETTIKLFKADRVITGTVTDIDGNPAKGILVAGGHQVACSEIVRTDRDGNFQFLYPEKTPLMQVIAYQKGTGLDILPTGESDPYRNEGITPPEKINNGPFHLKLAKIEPVKIRIVNEEGKPMAGASVTPWLIQKPCQLPKPDHVIWGSPYNKERSGNQFNTSGLYHCFEAIADENGIAILESVPQTFLEDSTLTARGVLEDLAMPDPDGKKCYYGDFTKIWNQLEVKDGLPIMTLPRQGKVKGSVKFEDGTPAANTRIALCWHNGSGGGILTNEKGEFRLPFNANTLFNIAVESDKGAAPAVFNFSVGDGSEEKQLDFTLKPGIKLFGTVTMPDGSPAEGFMVYIEEKDPNPPPSFRENQRDALNQPELRQKGDVYTIDSVTRYAGDKRGKEGGDGKSADGTYEYLLPAVAREYSIRAVKYPSEKNSTQLEERKTNFRLMGNETEVRLDFHLKPHDPMKCDPEPELPEEVKSQQYASTGLKPTAGPNDVPTANPMIPENPVVKVLDENGKPFVGVNIEVRYGGDEGGNFNVVTDDRGIASTKELLGKKGTCFVVYRLLKAGYVSRYSDWDRPPGSNNILPAEVVYKLQKGVEIGGVVVDGENRPIQGARVQCMYDAPDRKNFLASAGAPVTDSEGKWTTNMAPPGITKFRLDVTHPEYQRTVDFGVYPPYEQLQNKTAIVMLQKGITVKGTVRDPEGKPLAGAKICVTKSGEEFSAVQPVKTDENGNFSIPNWREGTSVVYVACPGYAPDTREVAFSLSKENPTVDFQLKPGKTVKFKVLDQRGNPISEARVGPFRWRGTFLLLGGDELIKQEADEQGNWEWTWAPDDEAEYSIRKEGYMSVRDLWLKPREEPYVYRMNDPLEISGKVIDSVTKQPVMTFKQTTGDNFDGRDPKKASYWDNDKAVQRTDGTYRAVFTEPREKGGHHVKIEADGYETYISEMYADSLGKVEQDVRLRKLDPYQAAAKKTSLKVTVQTPDGKPAAGAQVGVGRVKDGNSPYISVRNGELDRCDEKYTADSGGNFTIPNFEGRIIIVVTHAGGVTQANDKTLEDGKPLQLIPWARAEGTLLLGTQPGKKCQVELSDILGTSAPFGGGGQEYGHTFPQCFNEATTDTNGKFVMERVAPTGKRKIEWNNDGRIVQGTHYHVPLVSADVELRPGQTTQVTLGGKGVPVVGKLTMPAEPAPFRWNWAVVTLKPDIGEEPPFMLYNYPKEVMDVFEVIDLFGGRKGLTQKKDATQEQIQEACKLMTEYSMTDEEKEHQKATSKYLAEKERVKDFKRYAYIDTEGRFRAENVMPGKYRVVVDIVVPKGDQRWESLKYYLGECTVKAEIPETPETVSDTPVDLGTLAFEWKEISVRDWQTRDWKEN